jgi:hypothetical protein
LWPCRHLSTPRKYKITTAGCVFGSVSSISLRAKMCERVMRKGAQCAF